MNGTPYLVLQILVFIVAASAIAFFLGRASRRPIRPVTTASRSDDRAEVQKLQAEKDELTAALTEARLQAASRGRSAESNEVVSLTARLDASDRVVEKLEARLASSAAEIDGLQSERATLQEQLQAARDATSEEDPGPSSEAVAALQDRVRELEEDLADRAARDNDAAIERTRLLAEVQRLENEVAAGPGDAAASAGNETEALRAEIDRLQGETDRLAAAASRTTELKAGLVERDERIARLEAALSRHQDTVADAAASIGVTQGGGAFADTIIEFDADE